MSSQPAPAGEPAASVGNVVALVRQIATQSELYANVVRRRLGIIPSDLAALGIMSEQAVANQPLSPTELATRLRMSPSAVTTLIDRLEGIGHLQRHPHASDGRRVVIGITPQAARTGWEAFRPLAEEVSAALADRSPDELAVIAAALADIVAGIDRASRRTDSVGSEPGS